MAHAQGELACIVGARPNYMKMAPLIRAFAATPGMPRVTLIHTGQHYDVAMNERLFRDLELPAPDLNLEVGSGTHAVQTAEVMRRVEPLLVERPPVGVVVVGDVNSTLAVALVAAKLAIPVVHVEAGLRSFDRTMPEEINRLLTDQLADLLFTTERAANRQLEREGVSAERVVFAGNVMIDSLMRHLKRATPPAETLRRANASLEASIAKSGYSVVTLHRPSNVDDRGALMTSLEIIGEVSLTFPVIWPVHPRTHANLERFGIVLPARYRVTLLPPQGYLEMIGLIAGAKVVLTDSGGVQEETTALGVPCLTMRNNTERPITIEEGTNLLVGRDKAKIAVAIDDIRKGAGKRGRRPELWDGHAAMRIAAHLAQWLEARGVKREATIA